MSPKLSSIEGVESYTSPRFWPKDSTNLVGSIHIQIQPFPLIQPSRFGKEDISGTFPSSRLDSVVSRVEGLLKERIKGLEELTVQVERAK